tara:strand:+ start:1286 stop:1450 length:165 start_codon:yes stop_codon:yes gene_type:complete
MNYYQITLFSYLDNYLPEKLIEAFQLGLVIFVFYALVINLLLTSREKIYYQKQW